MLQWYSCQNKKNTELMPAYFYPTVPSEIRIHLGERKLVIFVHWRPQPKYSRTTCCLRTSPK